MLPLGGAALAVGDPVTLGIRPEHLNRSETGPCLMEVTADVSERLGSDTYCHVRTDSGEPLTVRIRGDFSPRYGERCACRWTSTTATSSTATGRPSASRCNRSPEFRRPERVPTMKLNRPHLNDLPARVARPGYDLSRVRPGIAHIGVGGFHRAHQAAYTDALMNTGEGLDWGICGIGTRAPERAMRDALAAQDHLYTLVELDDRPDTEVRVIGALRDMLLVDDSPETVVAQLADPAIRIVSLTITEGGYCIDDATGAFRADLPEIQHDLAQPQAPISVFGLSARPWRGVARPARRRSR